jgi:hypothetical protein
VRFANTCCCPAFVSPSVVKRMSAFAFGAHK